MALRWTAVSDLQTLVIQCCKAASDLRQQQIAGLDVSLLSIQTELNKLRGTSRHDLLPEAVLITATQCILGVLSCRDTPSAIEDLFAAAAYTMIAALELHVRVSLSRLGPMTPDTAALLAVTDVATCRTKVSAWKLMQLQLLQNSLTSRLIHLSITTFCNLLRLTASTPSLLDLLSDDLENTDIISHLSALISRQIPVQTSSVQQLVTAYFDAQSAAPAPAAPPAGPYPLLLLTTLSLSVCSCWLSPSAQGLS